MNREKPPEECQKCHFLDSFHKKSYLKNTKAKNVKEVKLLLFGCKNEVEKFLSSFCEPCTQYANTFTEKDAIDSRYKCGDVNVLVAKQGDQLPETAEEDLIIRLTGQRNWGLPMRSSGIFSRYLLQRDFGRDNQLYENKPNAVLVLPVDTLSETLASVEDQADKEKIPFVHVSTGTQRENKAHIIATTMNEVYKNIFSNLKSHYVEAYAESRYQDGTKEAKQASEREYQKLKNDYQRKVRNISQELRKEAFEQGYKAGMQECMRKFNPDYEVDHQETEVEPLSNNHMNKFVPVD